MQPKAVEADGSSVQDLSISPRTSAFLDAETAESDDAQAQSGDDADNDVEDLQDSERPGKRRRPTSVSCELCKQRKVKCDRGQPACGWCSRNNILCEYKARKKPGLRAGYGRELEQRLDRLEEILRSHSEILQKASMRPQTSLFCTHHAGSAAQAAPRLQRGRNASLPIDHNTPPDIGPGPPSSICSRSDPERPSEAEAALFVQRSSTVEFSLPPPTPSMHDGSLNVSAVSQSEAAQAYYGSGSSPTQPDLLPSPVINVSHHREQITSDQDLPPYDLLYTLVDLYFTHINTWCPILYRKSTLESLFGPQLNDVADRVLLHAMVAATLRFSTDDRLTEEKRKHYHEMSKQRVLLYGMEHSSVKALQAMVILALDLIGSSNGPPCWNIMALITRSVVHLGLTVESNSFSASPNYTSIHTLRAMTLPEPQDFVEDESRRRLFWMIYLLDRYATISTSFDFALNDKDIDRTLPCRDDLWVKKQKVETRRFRTDEARLFLDHEGATSGGAPEHDVDKPENLGAFGYYIEILGILSKIHLFLKQPVDIGALPDVESWQMRYKQLDSMLSAWKFNLPGDFGNMARIYQISSAKGLTCCWIMLHATFHTATIRLHSSAAYPTSRSPIFTPSYSASHRCFSAVENIAALSEFVVLNGLLSKLGPPFAFTLWVAARLLLVHGSTVEHRVGERVNFFVDTLREMSHHWPVAGRYCELLSRVLDEYRESKRQDNGVTPSSVEILADMRRAAFDLDSLISRHLGPTPLAGGFGANGAERPCGNGEVGWTSQCPSETPTRASQLNELEYLDVFGFFNMPKLPDGGGVLVEPNENESANGTGTDEGPAIAADPKGHETAVGGQGSVTGQFNITDYMVDANRDWLFQ